jgi:acyl dehydratase
MPSVRVLGSYLRATFPRPGSGSGLGSGAGSSRVLHRELRPRAEDVASYCAVVGQARSDRLPPLYPHLFGFGLQLELMGDPSFPFPALGLVHITNEVTLTRPLPIGARFDSQVLAGAVRPHRRGRVVDVVTTVRCDGEPVWHETSGYLHRERSPHTSSGTDSYAGSGDGDAGPLHPSARWRLPADLGRRYARVSGDLNPIHLWSWTARPLGFRHPIAHGMWTAAAVLAALEGRLPDSLRYTVQFRRPVALPGTVRLFTAVAPGRIDAEVRGPDGDDRARLVGSVQRL